jgi:hypothetical protein
MNRILSVAAALLPAILAAQAPSAPAAAPLPATIPIHTAPDDPVGGPYGVWAAGHGYKVSFHGEPTFHVDDAVGCAALAFRVTSLRIGGHELHDAARTPTMQWTATRYEYEHGTFVAAYDVRAEGVEQTFVVPRPTGELHGDLVVSLHVDGALAPRANDDGGIAFVDALGNVRVTATAPVAIDANGVRRAMRTEVDGATVRYRCDAAWLARAAWPVTVDPLLQPNPALIVSPKVVAIDLLRDDDETTRNLWIATVTESASGERDLLVRRCDDGFANAVTVFTDIATSHDSDDARLAASGVGRKVVVVFTRDFGAARAVRWHAHAKDSIALLTSVGVLTPPGGSHDWRADVGGTNAFSIGTRLLLVWQRETTPTFQDTADSRVFAALLDVAGTGNGTLGTPFRLDARDDFDQDHPAVTPEAEGGQAFSWVTAWRGRGPGIAPFRVSARRVGNDMLVGSRFDAPTGLFLETQGAPRIAGAEGRYVLSYGTGNTGGGGFAELVAVRLDWPHGVADAVRPHDVFPVEVGFPTNAELDALAFDNTTRCHWLVTWRDVVDGAIRVSKLGFRGREIERAELTFPFQERQRGSACAFDDDRDAFVVLGATEHTTATQPGRLHLATVAFDTVAFPSESGIACGPGRMRWHGSQHLGDEFTATDLVQGVPLTPTFLALATAPANVPLAMLGAPQCTLLVDAIGPGLLATVAGVTDSGGRLPLPLPLPEGLAPMDLHLQAIQFTPSGSSLGVSATRALRVPLGR